jgi:chromate transporter
VALNGNTSATAYRWRAYLQITAAMVRTGVLGYGGGPSIIPLVRYEAVTRYRWLDDSEFGEVLAFANALPGPIATKMAAYLGWRVAGVPGAVWAVIAHILPSSAAMLVLFGVYEAVSRSPVAAGMVAAVSPVIAVMLGMMAYEFAAKAWKGLGRAWTVVFAAIAFALLQLARLNAGLVVVLFLAYGAFHLRTGAKLGQLWHKGRTAGSESPDKEAPG